MLCERACSWYEGICVLDAASLQLSCTKKVRKVNSMLLTACHRLLHCKQHVLLQVILSGENMADNVSTANIADKTEGFSGSDLRQLCTAAAMCGIRDLMKATSKASKADAAAKQARSKPATSKQEVAACDSAAASANQSSSKSSAEGNAAKSATAAVDASSASTSRATADNGTPSSTSLASEADHLTANSATAEELAARTKAAAAASAPSTQSYAGENGVSSVPDRHVSAAGKQSKGSKRDSDLPTASSTKRHKASTDRELEPSAAHQGSAEEALGDWPHANGMTDKGSSHTSSSKTPQEGRHSDAQSQAQSQSPPLGQAQGELQQTASASNSIVHGPNWLLAKYNDVAAAADQKVSGCCHGGACVVGARITPTCLPDHRQLEALHFCETWKLAKSSQQATCLVLTRGFGTRG